MKFTIRTAKRLALHGVNADISWKWAKKGAVFEAVEKKEHAKAKGVLSGNVLHLETRGSGAVYIYREGRLGSLSTQNGSTRGFIADGDIFLFTIHSLKQELHDTAVQFFSSGDPESIAQALEQYYREKKENEPKGFLVVAISQKTSKKLFIPRVPRISLVFQKFTEIIRRGIYTFRQQRRRKKILIAVAAVCLGMLLGSVVLQIKGKQQTAARMKLEDTLRSVSEQYQESSLLVDLNPVRARELLAQSKLSMTTLLGEFPKDSEEYKTVSGWIEKIGSEEIRAYHINKLTSAPLFFDINLIKEGGEGMQFARYLETMAILDSKNHVVYLLATDTKRAEILAGGNTVKNATSIAIHGGNVYFANEDGVVSIDRVNKSASVVIPHDSEWGEINSIASFAGNIYLLDRTNHMVWRYLATEDGFSTKQQYLTPEDGIRVADATRLVIDGSVWIVTPARLLKFIQGVPNPFEPSGFSDTVAATDGFYASDDDTQLYLLDKMLARIVVLDKDGVYQSQYQWDELKNANDFVVSEKEKKIFVLVGSKIYGIDLK